MSADIKLQVAGREIREFISFRADSDLFQAADAFEASFSDAVTGAAPAPGQPVKLYVDNRLEFTGVLDAVDKNLDKSGVTVSVRGRDLMGILVDSCVETFTDVSAAESLTALARRLLAKAPFINRKDVTLSGKPQAASAIRVEPGQTIFDVLKSAAHARGLLFYSMPNGTFVFGKPKTTGTADFSISVSKARGSNILSGSVSDDISGRHSKVVVMGSENQKHIAATVSDSETPFYKPLVTQSSGDESAVSAAKYAQTMIDEARYSGFSLRYTVPGFGQNGKNYTPNSLCRVSDDALNVSGVFLVFGRTFSLDRDQGATTELRLSKPGVNPS